MPPRRLSENVHLRRYPHSSSLRRTEKHASFLRISDALHLNIFRQPPKIEFSDRLLGGCRKTSSCGVRTELRHCLNSQIRFRYPFLRAKASMNSTKALTPLTGMEL